MDEQPLSLGLWIKRRRKALDLTQDALAALVGCSKDLIVKIEGDARRPSREIATLLATQLQLAPEEVDDFIRCARAELAPDRLPSPAKSVPRAAFSSRRPAEHPGSNLPAPLSSFLGRAQELAKLRGLLQPPNVRLVTLTGPGGTGKTRLALQAAAERAEAFPDGVFFVDLAPISDPELVVTTIAQAVGVMASSEQSTEQLKVALRHQRLLLLLDNFEQVLDAAPLVAELLAAAPGLKVLATSRARLHLSGEREYAVPPLALPPAARALAHSNVPRFGVELTQYAAVQLFIERAQAVKADFAVTNANAPAVAEICVRLDGLPLAIELAAARIKLFPPEAMLAHLSHPLALLTTGPRDLPARQQTIRSTIDWSYELLSSDEQRLFRRLGVFVGGFTLEAAAAVASELQIEHVDLAATPRESTLLNAQLSMLDSIQALLDHSLLIGLEPAEGEPRYGMLETLREYALDRLRAAGEETAVRRRHAAFFAAWVLAIRPSLSADNLINSPRIMREMGNFRAMLDWSLATSGDDALYGLQLFSSIWEHWFLCLPTEGGAIAERALACASARDQDIVAAQIYNAAARLQKNPWASTRSVELLERSLALARQCGDRRLQAEVLRHLGEATSDRDLQAATAAFEESLRICRELNDTEQEGWTTHNLGNVATMRGDLDGAERCYQRGLAIFAALSHSFGQAVELRKLAILAEQRGDQVAADNYLVRSEAFVDRFGRTVGYSPRVERGRLACQRGDYLHALDLLRTAYEQVVQTDARGLGTYALVWQAVCQLELGDLTAATELCRQTLTIAIEESDGIGVSQIGMILANIAVAAGMHTTATHILGSVNSYLASISYTFEHDDQTDWKRLHHSALIACRAALGEEAFEEAWAEGQALTLEQAVAEALAIMAVDT